MEYICGVLCGIVFAVGEMLYLSYIQSVHGDGFFTLRKRDYAISLFANVAAGVIVVPWVIYQDMFLIKACSLAVLVFVLFTSSLMDRKSGEFLVLPLLIGVALQAVLLCTAYFTDKDSYSGSDFRVILAVIAVLLLFSIKGYSLGDFGILAMCFLSYVLLKKVYCVEAILITLTVAGLCFLVQNAVHFREIRADKNIRFPFTTDIAIGTVCALFLCL